MVRRAILLFGFLAYLLASGLCVECAGTEECPQDLAPLPESLHDVVTRAEALDKAGDAGEAARLLVQFLKDHPGESHPYLFYVTGYFLWQAGKGDDAVPFVERTLERESCFVAAWQLLASLYQGRNNPGKAAEILEKAGPLQPDPRIWIQAALLWLEAGQPRKALAVLAKMPLDQGKGADWHVAMAQAHVDLKDTAKAAESMVSAHGLSQDPEHLYQAAVLWLEAGHPARALPLLQELTRGDLPQSHWLVALSNALGELQKKEERALAMEKAASISRDPELSFHAAYLWLEANQPKRALGLLEKLAEKPRPHINWLLLLANTHIALDQARPAAEVMDRVVSMDDQSEYLYNAGLLWLQAADAQKALGHLVPLCNRSPAKASWFVGLAHAWLAQKDILKAARAMEQAADLSKDPEHAYQAGLMWLQVRRAEDSLRLLVPLSLRYQPRAEWLTALSSAWVIKENYGHAAVAMERAAKISGTSEHAYQAASLWLHAEEPRKALPLLEALAGKSHPEVQWLVLLSETWRRLEDLPRAAQVMERASRISGNPEHAFRAGQLWIEAGLPENALPLLTAVTRGPSPRGNWFVVLSHCFLMLEENWKAAEAMERAADITQKGEDYYRGGMLYLQADDSAKGLALLYTSTKKPPVQQEWLVSLAQALLQEDREQEALSILEQTDLVAATVNPRVRYQGAGLWLHFRQPVRALPILEVLCASREPVLEWLVSLVQTHMELDSHPQAEKALLRLLDHYPERPEAWRLAVWVALQQSDYARAAAAMAVAARLGPPEPRLLKELADLYHMAGTPLKAAAVLKKAWKGEPAPEDWDRLARIYRSGHRYEMALEAARAAAKAQPTAERWETVGSLAFRLRQFEESYQAYRHSAGLSPHAAIRLRAGYAALRLEDLEEAARLFTEALQRSEKNSVTAREAHRNLAYVNRMKVFLEESSEAKPSLERPRR